MSFVGIQLVLVNDVIIETKLLQILLLWQVRVSIWCAFGGKFNFESWSTKLDILKYKDTLYIAEM